MVLAGAVLLVGWYVASYAPALWIAYRSPFSSRTIGSALVIYRPVEWLIDETSLRGSLYAWAEWWGVEDEQLLHQVVRDAGATIYPS